MLTGKQKLDFCYFLSFLWKEKATNDITIEFPHLLDRYGNTFWRQEFSFYCLSLLWLLYYYWGGVGVGVNEGPYANQPMRGSSDLWVISLHRQHRSTGRGGNFIRAAAPLLNLKTLRTSKIIWLEQHSVQI